MAFSPPYAVKRLVIDAVSWSAPPVPFGCNSITVFNPDANITVKLRTDATDPNTEISSIPPSGYTIVNPAMFTPGMLSNYRFDLNSTPIALQAVSGSPTVIIMYAR